jgi:hypothetical protein
MKTRWVRRQYILRTERVVWFLERDEDGAETALIEAKVARVSQ